MKQDVSKILGVDENDAGDLSVETLDVATILEKDTAGVLNECRTFADNLIAEQTFFVVEPETAIGCSDVLRSSQVGKMRGDPDKKEYMGVSYHIGLSGEATTHPHIRQPPVRKDHYEKMVRGTLLSRFPAGIDDAELAIDKGDLYCVHDAFRHGNETVIANAFKAGKKVLPKEKYQLFLQYSEKSLRARRGHASGLNAGSQVEYAWMITERMLQVVPKNRLNFQGSNTFNQIGPINIRSPEEMWCETVDTKKNILGDTARSDVGGPTPGVESASERRAASDIEPVAYHGQTIHVWEELTHSYNVKGWIDLTALEEILALHCVVWKLPYIGFCYTEEGRVRLIEQLRKRIFVEFQNEQSPLYHPPLVKLLGRKINTATPGGTPKPTGKGKAKAGAKPAPKRKGKAKGKAKATRMSAMLEQLKLLQNGDEDGEEEEPEEDEEEASEEEGDGDDE